MQSDEAFTMESQTTQAELDRLYKDYVRHGYLLVRNGLSAQEMAPIQEQWQRVRDGLRNGRVVDGMHRDNFYIHGKLPGPFGDIYRHPSILRIVKRLLGDDIALYINRLNVKDTAFHDPIHLHQDIPYFSGGETKMNVFVALQHINLNNGAMVYVPKSHNLGILDRNTIDISKHPELEVLVPSLCPGDLVFAHINLWHSSVPNTQQTDRVLLQIIYQPATDGSYYPLSVPEPTLVAGNWRTAAFTPWKTITASTTSQLDKDKAAMQAETSDNTTRRLAESNPMVRQVRPAAGSSHVQLLKSVLPVSIKQPLKNLLYKKKLKPRIWVGSASEVEKSAASKSSTLAVTSSTPSWDLPEYFTASTGPKQVWSLTEDAVDWLSEITPTVEYLKRTDKRRVLLAACEGVGAEIVATLRRNGIEVCGYIHIAKDDAATFLAPDHKSVHLPKDLPRLETIDAIIVMASRDFSYVIRKCEQYLRNDIVFVPGTREAIVPEPVRTASIAEWATRSSILTYLYVSGLRGNFAEFGTFWGRAFYSSYFELSHWLQGKFYAFDSFEGLSDPDGLEKAFTSGDFIKGAYGFNLVSFGAIGEVLGLPNDRIVTVPGFFNKSLTPATAQKLGIAPRSLSVVRIDCDLFDPTMTVLDFISPLLDDGALIYFDDWRLCRADPALGERGAALKWLDAHPGFELVDFHSIHWQHQWFIFHRNRPTRSG